MVVIKIVGAAIFVVGAVVLVAHVVVLAVTIDIVVRTGGGAGSDAVAAFDAPVVANVSCVNTHGILSHLPF